MNIQTHTSKEPDLKLRAIAHSIIANHQGNMESILRTNVSMRAVHEHWCMKLNFFADGEMTPASGMFYMDYSAAASDAEILRWQQRPPKPFQLRP